MTGSTLPLTLGTCQMRSKGVDLVSLAAMTGHDSLDCAAICTRLSEENIADAVQKLALE